jgi:hypothetical protein
MNKISKPSGKPNLPGTKPQASGPQLVDPEVLFRTVCESIVNDPVSSASDKLRALEAYMRFRPEHETSVDELARAEVADLSGEQLDELLGILTHPLGQRDQREVEREQAQRNTVREAEFEQRVELRVRELVDVAAVEARIEQRARDIAAQGRPLAAAPIPPHLTSGV